MTEVASRTLDVPTSRPYNPWMKAWLRLYSNKTAMAGLVCFVLLILMVLFAPLLAPHDPNAIDYENPLKPPSSSNIFGTDDLGRDVFSRVLWGGRESISVGVFGMVVAILGGTLIGLITGYFGGWFDSIAQRIIEILLAFPAILFLLCIIAVLGPSLTAVFIAISIASIPSYARVVRGSVLSVKSMEFVTAAQIVGAGRARIMFRYILPNMLGPILVYGTLGVSQAIMLTAGLSYIGLGAQPPSPEWGAMLNYGRNYLMTAPWMSIFPGLAVFIAVLSINLFGDGLRDALDPKTRR